MRTVLRRQGFGPWLRVVWTTTDTPEVATDQIHQNLAPFVTRIIVAAIAGSLIVLGLPLFQGVASGASPDITSPSVTPSSVQVGTPLTFTWTVTSSAPLSSTAIYLIDPS